MKTKKIKVGTNGSEDREKFGKFLDYLDKNKIEHAWLENNFRYTKTNIDSFIIVPIYKEEEMKYGNGK
ncbi:MAG: hypothetical protein KBT03_02920 [Bacteroidales bacterium]|nr:hypothetical protein [Candidatus Scybalousia scybalohippi]